MEDEKDRDHLTKLRDKVKPDYDALPRKIEEQRNIIRDVCKEVEERIGVSADILMNTTIPLSTWQEYVNVKRQTNEPYALTKIGG